MKKNKIIISTIKKLYKIVRKYNTIYPLIIFIFSIISSVIPFISLLNTQTIINKIQLNYSIRKVYINLIIFIFVNILSISCGLINSFYLGKYKELLYLKINEEVLNKTNKLTYVDFEDSEIYDLLQRAEMEAGVRPISIFSSIINIVSSIITILGSLLILILWKWWICFGFVILSVSAFKYYKYIGDLEYKTVFNRTKYERKSWYIAHLLTKDSSIKEIKILNLFKHLMNDFCSLREKFYKENIKILKMKTKFLYVYQLTNIIFMTIIVLIGINETFLHIILVGNLMTYINASSKVDNSLNTISNSLFSLYQDCLYASNIVQFLDLDRERTLEEKSIDITTIDEIEFRNISFKYPKNDRYILKNISFKIKKGETIAIVGKNGSGKSTIIKILCGLYPKYEGNIFINNIDLKRISQRCKQKLISVVFQDFNSYQFTIKENIGFGDIDNINDYELIVSSAVKANADQFIELLPNKYNQQVGNWFENGLQLSGGEWQKLALSRSFMTDSKLLVLDEPTATLDPISEYNFFDAFLKSSQDKISIFVTHRYSNAKLADIIIVLDEGEICGIGTHDSLMLNCSLYKKMYEFSQFLGKKEV